MKLRLAAVLMMLVMPVLAASVSAVSFDCSKATTPFETAICGDPALSEKDEVLAVAYATATGGLSDNALQEMRAGQRSWLDYAQRSCTSDAKPIGSVAYDEEGLACLRTTFQNRTLALESSRMLNGHRVYSVDRYWALPDPEASTAPDYAWKVATKSLSTPRIDGTGPLAEAFNAFMEEEAAAFDGLFSEVPPQNEDFYSGATSDNEVKLTVTQTTPRRITVTAEEFWYGHGAAHGNYTISYRHFLGAEERPLQASDIFVGDQWSSRLLEAAVAALKSEHGDALMLGDPQDIAEVVEDPARWNFTDDRLIIQFQPYEVAAYAYGAPTVSIRFEELADLLAPDAILIAASY